MLLLSWKGVELGGFPVCHANERLVHPPMLRARGFGVPFLIWLTQKPGCAGRCVCDLQLRIYHKRGGFSSFFWVT